MAHDNNHLAATAGAGPGRDGVTGDIKPGMEVAGYRIESLRGEGGFASVFRAVRIATGEVVAFKALHPHLGTSRVVLARFQREIETITRLDHKNIVEVSDSGELSPGRPFYVM